MLAWCTLQALKLRWRWFNKHNPLKRDSFVYLFILTLKHYVRRFPGFNTVSENKDCDWQKWKLHDLNYSHWSCIRSPGLWNKMEDSCHGFKHLMWWNSYQIRNARKKSYQISFVSVWTKELSVETGQGKPFTCAARIHSKHMLLPLLVFHTHDWSLHVFKLDPSDSHVDQISGTA